ncbi:stage II sporulation protein P [Alteribacter natronophilus]|uniref:stage II sporulation protein P n=1 Tax=Alteribacter natronophilus TaxID=2583810 RepID=UPI00110DF549|nr:stage II sporulation protein P [Alteribacter natronophilus]TMW73874.1 stage II sporulation protein P [Alteribacter natronophilus]
MRQGPYRPAFKSRTSSFRKYLFTSVTGVLSIFIMASILTAFGPGYSLSSASISDFSDHLTGEMLVHVIGTENRYLTQELPEDSAPPQLSSLVFELATSIDPDDPRSLLARELPGIALFGGEILVAGEGTDFTTMPMESAPPAEVMMEEREAATERLEEMDEMKEAIAELTAGKDPPKTVHIIHSHNRESFLPELKDPDIPRHEVFHESVNITLAGERLGQELAKRGIGSVVDTSDVTSELRTRGWQYGRSYDMSRELVEEAISEHEDLKFFFDLHRDSVPREVTTATINGEVYARTFFVIGRNHESFEKNKALAEDLHSRIEEKFPGLSRGVFVPDGPGSNSLYNQDLSENSLVVEFGGIDNTLDEVYRSVEAFAEVFADFYFEKDES